MLGKPLGRQKLKKKKGGVEMLKTGGWGKGGLLNQGF